MRICLVYISVTGGKKTEELASRFIGTYLRFSPGASHEGIAVCNGGPPSATAGRLFQMAQFKILPRLNDDGWDISAYQEVADRLDKQDMIVCLGESVYFHRQGWLERIVSTWNTLGPGMYGFWASNLLRPHLNTTAFACRAQLLQEFPKVRNRPERYHFEHGDHSFWQWVLAKGYPVRLVTWKQSYGPHNWRDPHNGFWSGNQEDCLAFCVHTDRYHDADTVTKDRWRNNANTWKQ